MRAGRRSVAVAALGFAPLACAVYDGGALGGQQAGDATTKGGGGASSGAAGPGTAQTGGASSTAGTSATPSAGSANLGGTDPANSAGSSGNGGGSEPTSGGESSAEAGAAGNGGESGAGNAASGGSAGSSGSAGSAGASTSGGAGGTSGHAGTGGTSGTSGAGGTSGSAGASGTTGTSGNAGSGGAPAGPLCSDHPLTLRSTWVASASSSNSAAGDTPPHLLDGKTTRWTTGKAQSGDEWLQIDFGATVMLNHVNLQQGTDTNDYPRSFALIVSDTANDLSGSVRLSGSGKSGVSTAILLPALASGRYLLIKQTGSSLSWWSAEELEVSCAD